MYGLQYHVESLVALYFFHITITAERYKKEILNVFNEIYQDKLQQGFLQQDGATAHTARETINSLQHYFFNQIISRGTTNLWPSRSPDFTPLDLIFVVKFAKFKWFNGRNYTLVSPHRLKYASKYILKQETPCKTCLNRNGEQNSLSTFFFNF